MTCRHSLVLALGDLSIRGDFRTTVEYLMKVNENTALWHSRLRLHRLTPNDSCSRPPNSLRTLSLLHGLTASSPSTCKQRYCRVWCFKPELTICNSDQQPPQLSSAVPLSSVTNRFIHAMTSTKSLSPKDRFSPPMSSEPLRSWTSSTTERSTTSRYSSTQSA